MADPFLAEIRIMANDFPPLGWAWCNGQILPITQNTALFSLLGTTYGGNGTTNFALPNLQGCAPMAPGTGPGLSPHDLGESEGSAAVILTEAELPAHNHGMEANGFPADQVTPTANNLAKTGTFNAYQPVPSDGKTVAMSSQSLVQSGGGQPHNNMQPYLTLYFNIALQGVFPQRG